MNNFMFDAMFTIVPIIIFGVFVLTFALIFSPKLRGKLMSHQIKAAKYMLDESKDSLSDLAGSAINIKKSILDSNEDALRDMTRKEASISKEGIEIKTRAIKDGLTKDIVYCKYCGESIDKDSMYCKHCGKKQ